MKMPQTIGVVHFIGIGGIGMSGIAEVLHNLGYSVQGSDQADSANVQRLRDKGIACFVGHAAENLGAADDDVVVAAVGDRVDGALHPGEVVADHRHARGRRVPPDLGELVLTGCAEGGADALLAVREDVHHERPALLDHRPGAGGLLRTEDHQRRVEGQRRERLAGEADRLVVGVECGDDRDAGAELPHRRTELSGIEFVGAVRRLGSHAGISPSYQ